MRLDAIDVRGFGCLRELRIDFDPRRANLILAPNETGKSTLLGAIEAALYGFPPRGQKEGRELRKRYEPWEGGPTRIILDLADDTHRYRVDFDVLDASNTSVEQVTVTRDGVDITDQMKREASTPGDWLLGLTREDFLRSVLVRQGELEAVANDIEALVRHLEQVVTSSRAEASASAALRRLDDALDNYRAKARLEHLAGDVLARARGWSRVETRLSERVEDLQYERSMLEERRSELATAIEAMERGDTRRHELEHAGRCLFLVEQETTRRQLQGQLDRDDDLRRRVDGLDTQIKSLDDVASFPVEETHKLSALREREMQHQRQHDAARVAAADAEKLVDLRQQELDELHDVESLADRLNEVDSTLTLLRNCEQESGRLTAELDASRTQLSETGVPLTRLETARARYERLTSDERTLVRGYEQRRLELDGKRHDLDDDLRLAQEVVAEIDSQRSRMRRNGLILIAVGLGLAVSGGGLVATLAANTVLGVVAGLLTMLVIGGLGAWLAFTGRQLRAYDWQSETASADNARRESQRVKDEAGTLLQSLERIAERESVTPEELLEEINLFVANRDDLNEYERLAREREDWIRQARQRREQFREWLAMTGHDRDAEGVSVATAEELRGRVERCVAVRGEVRNAGAERQRALRAVADCGGRLLETQESLRRLLDSGGVKLRSTADDEPVRPEEVFAAAEAFEGLAERAAERGDLVRQRDAKSAEMLREDQVEKIRRRLAALPVTEGQEQGQEQGQDAGAALAFLNGFDVPETPEMSFADWQYETIVPEQCASARREIERLATEVRRGQAEHVQRARGFLQSYGQRRPELDRELTALTAELTRGREFAEAIDIAATTLHAVQMESYERWSDLLKISLTDLLTKLLPDYRLDTLGKDLSVVLLHIETGTRLALDEISRHLSRGAKDRFFLAMRAALARALGAGRAVALPLLLDDPLANCDDWHFRNGLAVLSEIAAGGTSLVVFSCQRSRCYDALEHDERVRDHLVMHELGEAAESGERERPAATIVVEPQPQPQTERSRLH